MKCNRGYKAAAGTIAAGLLLGLIGGCSSKLDTGYEPRKLGASDEARRGYYAQPFGAEAGAAKKYEQDFGEPRRTKQGY